MANTLKPTVVERISSNNPAANPNDLVRKNEVDAALAAKASSSDVDTAIASATHPPVTKTDSNSVAISLTGQLLSADVKIPAETTSQTAATGLTDDFSHPVVATDSLDTNSEKLTTCVVERRLVADNSVVALGVEDTDYTVDLETGIITILTGSNLVTASAAEKVTVTLSREAITVGPALEITPSGVEVKLGTARNQAAKGDHTHANDHRAATVDSANKSVALAISSKQKISAEVVAPVDGGLKVTNNGLEADFTKISATNHGHANATQSAPGFMSAADKTKLDGLNGGATTFDDTSTVDLSVSPTGHVTADVKKGAGITEDETGLAVDFDAVAAKDHVHDPVSDTLSGFMTPDQKADLEDQGTRLTAAEADILTKADATATATALAGKAPLSHTHPISDVIGLQAALDGKSPVNHTHPDVTDVASGFATPEMKAKVEAIPSTLGRDLARFDLCDCGEFDGEVRAIAIVGDHVYVGGAFTRWGNVDSAGLARLDMKGQYDPFFQIGTGFSQAINFLKSSDDGLIAASIDDGSFRSSVDELPVWRVNEDGTRDTTFTSPATIASLGADQIASVAVLSTGKICVLTPQTLTVLNADGSIFFQANGSARFNWITEFGEQLLLSSDAFSAPNTPQTYDGTADPKALKLLNFGADSAVKVAFVSDFGTNTSPTADVAAATKRYAADHWIFGGDNNYDTGSALTIDDNWGNHYRKVMNNFIGSGVVYISTKAGSVGTLKRCNLWDGTVTDVATFLDGVTNVVILDLAVHPTTGVMYGVSDSAVYTINKTTAALTKIADTTASLNSLAFNASGTLYAASVDSPSALYTINTTTGELTKVSKDWSGFTPAGDIEFSKDGTLFITSEGTLYTVDLATGDFPHQIGLRPHPDLTTTQGLSWFNGELYGFWNGSSEGIVSLVKINTVTGYKTVLFDLGGSYAITGSSTALPPLKNGESDATADMCDAVIGNHDAGNVVGSGYSYDAHTRYLKLPGNGRVYSRVVGDAEFFYMNSDKNEPLGYDAASSQWDMIKGFIAASNATHKWAVMHHSPRCSESGYTGTWMDFGTSVFQDAGLDGIISGHGHVAEHIIDNDFHYVVCGIGGKSLRAFGTPVAGSVSSSRYNADYGFIGIEITHTDFKFKFINRVDQVIYEYTVNKTPGEPAHQAAGGIDQVWALNSNAGTGGLSSCGRSVVAPNRNYFIVGNALANFNSIDTSWNAEMKGNMLLYSEQFSNAVWQKVGSPVVVTDDTNTAPDSTSTADTITDSDGTDLAYVYQDATIPNEALRYEFSIYVKKDSDTTRFPVVELKLTGGTTEVSAFAHLNTQTGEVLLSGNTGGGSGAVTCEDEGTYWRVTIAATNNTSGNVTLRAVFYPAYSNTMGGSALSLTGSAVVWGAQATLDWWNSDYVKTTTDAITPTNTASNADRFRGIYKIKSNGKEDPDFECNITLSEAGHVIPFAIDAQERIYIGGPIASIDGITVTPWRLYRLNANGTFSKEYPHFNDNVLDCAISDCGTLITVGAFTAYGSHKCGRIAWLNPDGTLDDHEPEATPIISDTAPDILEHPCYKKRLWVDTATNPSTLRLWNEATQTWDSICDICAVRVGDKLPKPVFNPPSGNAPLSVTISVPGYPNALIYYTDDGTDPDESSTPYTGAIPVLAETTLKAVAYQLGFVHSDIAVAYYYDSAYQQCAPVEFDPPSGTVVSATAPLSVTLTCATAGADIHYTLDGSEVTEASPLYTAPIDISAPTTINARAYKVGYSASDPTSADYPDETGGRLINIDFMQASDTPNTGQAAAPGGTVSDFWNTALTTGLSVSDLKYADQSDSGVDLVIPAAPAGQGYNNSGNGAGNQMYSIAMILTDVPVVGVVKYAFAAYLKNLQPGKYDIYIYSDAGTFTLRRKSGGLVADQILGTKTVTGVDPLPWVNGENYVKFSNVSIDSVNQSLEIDVAAGGQIAGIQILQYVTDLPDLPQVAFDPSGGEVPVNVALSVPGIDAPVTIFYETNPANPVTPSSPQYVSPILVSSAGAIRAFARKPGYDDSILSSASYGASSMLGVLPPIEIWRLTGIPETNFALGIAGWSRTAEDRFTMSGPATAINQSFGVVARVQLHQSQYTSTLDSTIKIVGAQGGLHPFRNGMPVQFPSTAPGGVGNGVTVTYVRDYNSVTGEFALSAYLGGPAIVFETQTSGLIQFADLTNVLKLKITSATSDPAGVTFTPSLVNVPGRFTTRINLIVEVLYDGVLNFQKSYINVFVGWSG
jgi:hypothetical protein